MRLSRGEFLTGAVEASPEKYGTMAVRSSATGVSEFLEMLKASGVRLWACKLAMEMFHLTQEDLYDDIDGVLTVGGFYERAQGKGTHLLFI